MSQPLTARQSLEQAIEDFGVQNEGPNPGMGLQQLARASLKDEAELIQAADEERRKLKLKKASRQQAAHAAEALFQAPSGFAAFTKKILQFYRCNGIEWPTVTVEYRNLNVGMEALAGSAGVPTVGNVLPQAAKDVFRRKGAQELHILKDINGVLKPGSMTLLLGGPGSGKSTLMKVLSGRLKGKNFTVGGSVLYNKTPFSKFVVERTAAYVDQYDRHLPVLTVAETMEFAHACAGKRPDFISKQELKEVYVRTMTGNGPGGTLPVLKSNGDLVGMTRSANSPHSQHTSAGDLLGLEASTCSGASASSGSLSSQQQGAEAFMSPSGFVHAKGEHELHRDELAELLKLSGTSFKVELVMRLLGLSHVRDTQIGSAMVRGVSGGERKRVTSGEMLVGNQRVLCMDEISTGLDSAILFSIITFLRQSVLALHSTALISLLQPPPEVMGLFDDIIVLTEGRVIYHGPVTEVQQHFQSLGFDLPPRMDVPSWLVEITTPSGQWRYASNKLKTIRLKHHGGSPHTPSLKPSAASQEQQETEQAFTAAAAPPAGTDPDEQAPTDASGRPVLLRSAEELSDAFWRDSAKGKGLLQEVQSGAKLCPTDHNSRALVTQRYALGVKDALTLAMKRQWIFFLRNKAFIVFRLLQMIVMGLIVGSLFYGVPASRTGVRTLLGASFICLMFLAFGSAPELGLLLMNRSVWYKHRDNFFLPTYAEVISMGLVRAANTVYESVVFSSIVYWMIGYARDAGAYFTYLLLMFCTSLSMSGLFRFIGAVAATPVHAQAFGSLGILALILTSGFAIIKPSIPGWWIWIYWLSPFSYALRAIVVNEMTHQRWSAPAPGNPQGLTLGEEGLDTFGFYTERYWIWVGVAYVLAFTLLMNYFAYLALKFYSGQQPRASLPDEREILKRRLKAEERKKNASVALTVMDGTSRAGSKTAKGAAAHSAWEGDAAGGNFEPITLVVNNLRYFVPNPSAGGKKKKKKKHNSSRGRSITSGRTIATTSSGSAPSNIELPAATSAAPGADLLTVDRHNSSSSAEAAGVVVRVSVADSAALSQGGTAAADVEDVPQELELLKGINAFAVPGNLVALMGGSGAGKTTLMDVIAGRKTVGRITGEILVNGLPKQQATWARQIGYVEQMDIHSSNTTVEEALWFSGRLRLPSNVSDAQVRARVDEVLAQVDMTERFGDLVGTAGVSGLPTEARKRLTIAVELMANPPVLFMDEPTSGFDARAAAIVMNVVRAVASAGHTVMVTIHQPSINIFEAFDTLLLLQRGGRVSYFGSLGVHSRALVEYLESVPGRGSHGSPDNKDHKVTRDKAVTHAAGTTKLPVGYNPATWMLEVTGGAMATLIPANTNVDWPEYYLASNMALENLQQADMLVTQGQAAAEARAPAAGHVAVSAVASALLHASDGSSYAQPFWRQLLECTNKALASYWKSPAYNLLRMLMTTACALVYGTMYYKVGSVPSPAAIGNVQNVMGVLFSGANFLGNINLMSGMPVFSSERVVFYRERAARMYDPLALGIATILAELPYVIAQATVFVPIVYFMVDFRHDAAAFFYYYLMNIASLMMFTSFGFFLVCATPMVELAQLFSSALNFLFNIFNGFTIVKSSIPEGWQWANRAVPPTWMIYGLAASQLGDNYNPIVGPGLAPGSTVSSYLHQVYGYEYGFRWWALLIVASYTVGFTVLAVVFLKYVSFLKR